MIYNNEDFKTMTIEALTQKLIWYQTVLKKSLVSDEMAVASHAIFSIKKNIKLKYEK